ncbi:type 4a pilus biogenesis protein PilO [Curtobacterium sp. Leaf261]|uniref:type 4a pilus biogenesis protein PilO n=1 Tax=Curtobacterium sp. Leaf261 TaxID=1736311 RepID=UPI0007002C80|nr:type 4a pilus biogenesis protein PilO [Curtobacterium sp. Leaf261]KQO63641.1 hypothetical protein ASF23_05270 [Curtobacterium sp. Leaf261]
MNRNKLSLVIALVAAVVVLAGGWFLGVQPQLATAARNSAQQATIEATNATNRSELARLQTQFTKLADMKGDLSALSASIPAEADTNSFITSLNDIAGESGVSISSIAVSDAAPYTSPVAPVAPSGTATASASPSATASDSASATPSAVATPAGPKTTTNAAITSSNFTVIPVSVGVQGSYEQALAFTKGAQAAKRLFLIDKLVSSTSTATAGGDGSGNDGSGVDGSSSTGASGATTWTLSGYIYVLNTKATAAPSTSAATATNG